MFCVGLGTNAWTPFPWPVVTWRTIRPPVAATRSPANIWKTLGPAPAAPVPPSWPSFNHNKYRSPRADPAHETEIIIGATVGGIVLWVVANAYVWYQLCRGEREFPRPPLRPLPSAPGGDDLHEQPESPPQSAEELRPQSPDDPPLYPGASPQIPDEDPPQSPDEPPPYPSAPPQFPDDPLQFPDEPPPYPGAPPQFPDDPPQSPPQSPPYPGAPPQSPDDPPSYNEAVEGLGEELPCDTLRTSSDEPDVRAAFQGILYRYTTEV